MTLFEKWQEVYLIIITTLQKDNTLSETDFIKIYDTLQSLNKNVFML